MVCVDFDGWVTKYACFVWKKTPNSTGGLVLFKQFF